jgi:hypothetical protein
LWYPPQSVVALYIYRVGRSCPARKSFYQSNLPGLLNLARNQGAPVRSVMGTGRPVHPACRSVEIVPPSSGLWFRHSTYESWSTRRYLFNGEVQIVFCGHWPHRSNRWDPQIWPVKPTLSILGANNSIIPSPNACNKRCAAHPTLAAWPIYMGCWDQSCLLGSSCSG